MEQDIIQIKEARSASLDLLGISEHLKSLGYPEKALDNYLHCGEFSTFFLKGTCGCSSPHSLQLTRRCDKRFCPDCSKIRQKRIKRRMQLYLRDHYNTPKKTFKFLTISPENYYNLEEGLKHIKQSFRKFYRRKYFRERCDGGFYVVEVTNNGNGWHIHLHCLIYSSRLTNVYQGKCPYCGQWYLKKDKQRGVFYCANRSCNKKYNGVIKKPRLVREFEESSGRSCFVDISHIQKKRSVINYCLKYIGVEKAKFQNSYQFAQFIVSSYNQRLISPFGDFSHLPKIKSVSICPYCDQIIRWEVDKEMMKDVFYIKKLNEQEKPPPDSVVQYTLI